MALSLAACGSDDNTAADTSATTTTVSTPTTTTTATFDLTPLVDIASGTQALNGSLANTFRFSDSNEIVNGITATMEVGDTLLDTSTADADVMNVTVTGATTATTVNIETINITYAVSGQDFTAVNTATTTYNIAGAVAGALSTPAAGSTIALTDFGRVLTVEGVVLTGTTALGSAETMTIDLSGATHGGSAASQTGVVIDGTTNANLETLNIGSNGTAANAFTLSVNNSETVGTVVTSGSADLTIRAAEALLDGKTVTGTASTGEVNLSFDTASNITTNAANWTGVDNIVYRDSDTTAANATLNSVQSGQNVEIANSVGTLTVTAQASGYASFAALGSLELNGSSATAGVTVTTYDLQNTTALNLSSVGLATSTSTTAANTISNLDGDYSTITITGDTSLAITDLDIEAVQTATTATTARAVTVDASGMTGNAFLSTTAADDLKVSYTITGTLGADTLVGNTSGSTLNGGAGADTLTGSTGLDTISGGAGADHIDMSTGSDSLTGGDGADTYDLNTNGSAASAQVNTALNLNTTVTLATSDKIILNVNGDTYETTFTSDAATTLAAVVTAHKTAILAEHGVTVASIDTNTDITTTGKADGTAFTSNIQIWDNSGTAVTAQTTTTTAGAAAGVVNAKITDFVAGDILDTVGLGSLGTGGYYEGATTGLTAGTAYGMIVITDQSYATWELAENAVSGTSTSTSQGVVVFLNSTSGVAEAHYEADLNGNDTTAAADKLITFDSITNLTDLASIMSADSFTI
jgi:S-layer protein